MPSSEFIQCDNGSYLYVRNLSRLWVTEDTISKRAEIKASVIGPAMPFVVGEYDSLCNAHEALVKLVAQIEGKRQQ